MTTKNQLKVVAEPGKQDVYMYREFDAPRDAVFKAFVDPKLVIHWLGPKNMKMRIDTYDIRTGGSYRYIHQDEKGNEYAFNGVVHEVAFPERLIQTFEFEGLPERGHVSLDTALFETLSGNRTRVTMQSVFKTVAARDGMVMSGMEKGLGEGFERLDELLTK